MIRMTTMICTAALLTSVGCKTPGDEAEADPPAQTQTAKQVEEPTEPETAKPAEQPEPRKMVRFRGTPHDQEHTKVSLTWKGGDAALYKSPGVVSKAVAKPKWSAGDAIAFEKSWMIVEDAPTVTAKEGAKLFEASSYEPTTGKLAEASRQITLESGDEVAVYKQAGEGYCYVGVGDDYYLSVCPQKETFDGEDSAFRGPKADDFEWWVLTKTDDGQSGWLQVDDSVAVEVKSTM